MNPRQKVLFSQLQIASVGLLIAGFGWAWKETMLAVFGLVIAVYGLIRLVVLARMAHFDSPDASSLDPGLWLPDEEEKRQEEEDEWEKALEIRMARHARTAPTEDAGHKPDPPTLSR